MTKRDTCKYHLLNSRGTTVYAGVTKDLERREHQHQRETLHRNTTIEKQGNCTTSEAARRWEKEQQKTGIPTKHKR